MNDVTSTVGHDRLARLMKRGTDFLGCEVAVLGGAMSWISERNLVSALSNAGAFGVIACGAMTPDLLDTEIAETKKRTDKPFGVNLITMHPMLTDLIDVCAQPRGEPRRPRRRPAARRARSTRIKGNGAKLICFAPAFVAGQEADPLGRRCAGHRGDGGGRPYRPGLDLGARPGDLAAARRRGADLRRRRHRPWRADRRLSGDGRGRRPARHPLRLRHRMHRPSQFQEGLHPRLGPRRDHLGADRSAPAGHPGPRAQESRDGKLRRQAARGRRSCSTRARSR